MATLSAHLLSAGGSGEAGPGLSELHLAQFSAWLTGDLLKEIDRHFDEVGYPI